MAPRSTGKRHVWPLRLALHWLLHSSARVAAAVATAAEYAAAGCCRLDELQRAVQREWGQHEEFTSERHIESGLFPWEEDVYRRVLRPGDRVLIVGCGSGRDLLTLLQRGWDAAGLDVAPECTAIARHALESRGLKAELYTGPVESVTLPTSFDVIVFSWFCYCYIPQASRRLAALCRVAEWLRPGGRVFISYIPSDPSHRRWMIRLAEATARLTRSDWRPEPGDVIIGAPTGRYFAHYQHQFREDEIEREARAAGLRVVCHERNTEAILVLAHKEA